MNNNNKVDLRIDESLTRPFFLTTFLTMYRTTLFSTQPQLAQVINHRLIHSYVSDPAGVTIPQALQFMKFRESGDQDNDHEGIPRKW